MTRRTGVPEEALRFGAWLKKARRIRGMSQAELAAEAGISGAEITYIENGKRNPTFAMAMKLVRGLRYRMVFVTEDEMDRIIGARDRRRKFQPEPEPLEVDTRNPNP